MRLSFFVKRRALKTVSYRVTASALAQAFCWVVWGRFEYNLVVLAADLFQMLWYYLHEKIWGD